MQVVYVRKQQLPPAQMLVSPQHSLLLEHPPPGSLQQTLLILPVPQLALQQSLLAVHSTPLARHDEWHTPSMQ